ncbi:MAG: HlyD family efflux transporter periplasmic adaptor subunit [Verrucomicrobia bacterium]|nr:HlyD family efflux transporter periplasmic adaptor subunit [Verrucomicrobiota bacterium]MCH8528282.1 HlyD family secretion protein [Kiritimatiellia bacterium]
MKSSKFLNRLRLFGGLLILLTAAIVVKVLRTPPAPPRERPVRAETPRDRLFEVGVLDPAVLARVLSPLNGHLSHVAADGSRVAEGDLVFAFDPEEIRSRIESQEEQIENRLEELESVESERQILVQTYNAISVRERAELAHAELALRIRSEGLRPEERRLLTLSIETAELDLEDRRERLQRQRELVERNFAPATSLDSFEREVIAAEALLDERRTQFELETRPLMEEERLSLQSAVDQNREIVERSLRRHQREVAAKDTEIAGVRLQLGHQREVLEDRMEELEKAEVFSPAAGILRLTRSLNWRNRSWDTIEVGRQTWTDNVLGEIVDPDQLNLRVLIHESDILYLRPGLKAEVRLTAFPEHVLKGSVTTVSALGLDRMDLTPIYRQAPPAQQAQFLAEIAVDTRDLGAMPGMTASVVIHLAEEETP